MSFLALSARESSLVQTFCESCVRLDITHQSVHMARRFVIQGCPTLKESYPSPVVLHIVVRCSPTPMCKMSTPPGRDITTTKLTGSCTVGFNSLSTPVLQWRRNRSGRSGFGRYTFLAVN